MTQFTTELLNFLAQKQDIDEFCGMYECNKAEFPRSDANAYVTFTTDKAGQYIAVLVLKEDAEQPLSSILGLIVHECVHIKQQIMENIGEDRPSSEFEAYLTQELSTTMIDEYFRRSKLFGKDKVLTQTNLATGETQTFQD